MYILMMVRGVVDRARMFGVFQAGKRGAENAIPIKARMEELGQCESVDCVEIGTVTPENPCDKGCTFEHGTANVTTSLTLMTVDVAGGKPIKPSKEERGAVLSLSCVL